MPALALFRIGYANSFIAEKVFGGDWLPGVPQAAEHRPWPVENQRVRRLTNVLSSG